MFSGKKKKEQLQAKRQRKREAEERQNRDDKLEDEIRERLVRTGQEVALEAIEAEKAAYYDAHGGSRGQGPRGRKEKRRARQNEEEEDGHQQRHQKNGGGRRRSGASQTPSASNGEGNDGASDNDEEYMYDAHGHGVRSAFKKESKAALDARRRLNYLPLADRQFMDAKVGIPFGRWFVMPRRVGDQAGAPPQGPRPGDTPAKKEEATDAKVVVRALVSEDGVGSSLCFPFSVDTPSRGWRSGEGNEGDEEVTAVEGLEVLSNATVVAPDGAGGEEGNDEDSASDSTADSSSLSSGSSDVNSDDGKKSDTKQQTSAESDDPALLLHKTVSAVEEARFTVYLKTVEGYPLPAEMQGLAASACERNLEVWRQLWRTVESSDVNVVVADARYPIVHMHLGLLHYLTRVLCKPCMLVLNKIDLIPLSVLHCWLSFIPPYLTSLGFSVQSSDDAIAFMRAHTPAMLRGKRKAAPIVVHTFTADPAQDTAHAAESDTAVERRRKTKQRRGRMYEQLRAGTINVAQDLAGDDEADLLQSNSNDAYDATANFKGKAKAERNLQADKRQFDELRYVSDKITELLVSCRSLAPAGKGVCQTDAPVAEASAAAVAPMRKAPKKKKNAHKGKKARAGKRVDDDENDESDNSSADDDGDGSEINRRGKTDEVAELLKRRAATKSTRAQADEDVLDTRDADDERFARIGFIGYPNVGKSSLLNCIRGTKVVSVSATPGHTKHLQTIPVPAEGVTLIDSPGLVAPYYGLPRPLEAVLGTHQIAQTRDPQSGVAFLASHLPLERIYGLRRPDDADATDEWSAYELCEAYAVKRGYYVKRGKGALDLHRAAIGILQEAYQGRLTLYFAAPELNYLQSKFFIEKVKPNLLLSVFRE